MPIMISTSVDNNDELKNLFNNLREDEEVERLNLIFDITLDAFKDFTKLLKDNFTLRKLVISNYVGDEGAIALADAIKFNTTLIELSINSCMGIWAVRAQKL